MILYRHESIGDKQHVHLLKDGFEHPTPKNVIMLSLHMFLVTLGNLSDDHITKSQTGQPQI